jgi:hypothetical protein
MYHRTLRAKSVTGTLTCRILLIPTPMKNLLDEPGSRAVAADQHHQLQKVRARHAGGSRGSRRGTWTRRQTPDRVCSQTPNQAPTRPSSRPSNPWPGRRRGAARGTSSGPGVASAADRGIQHVHPLTGYMNKPSGMVGPCWRTWVRCRLGEVIRAPGGGLSAGTVAWCSCMLASVAGGVGRCWLTVAAGQRRGIGGNSRLCPLGGQRAAASTSASRSR